jgi:hypothetical protein
MVVLLSFGHPAMPLARGQNLLPLPLQLRNELLEVLPLGQGIEIGVFLHVHRDLEK